MVGGWLTCVAFCVTKKMWTLLIKLRHILCHAGKCDHYIASHFVWHSHSVICSLCPLLRKTSDRSGQNRLSNEPLHPTKTETESETKNDAEQWATPSTNQNRKRIGKNIVYHFPNKIFKKLLRIWLTRNLLVKPLTRVTIPIPDQPPWSFFRHITTSVPKRKFESECLD